jgi:hypothetical protein
LVPFVSFVFKNSPELALTLTLALLPLSEQERGRAPRLAADIRNWDEFTFWTLRHGVLGSVLANIKSLGLSIPPATLARLEGLHRQGGLRDMQLIAALGQVDALLRANQLDYLTLKGPALSQVLFGSPFIRHSGDIDLLVQPADVLPAEALLLTAGYSPVLHKPPLSAMQLQRYMQYRHHFVYQAPEGPARVELHWAMREPYFGQPDTGSLFARRQSVTLAEKLRLETLSDEDALINSLLHGASHHWNRAKYFLDLFGLLGRDSIDFKQIVGIITSCQLSWPAAQGLQLSREIFGREIPAHLGAFLELENPSIRYLKTAARTRFPGPPGRTHPAARPPPVVRYPPATRIAAFFQNPGRRLAFALLLAASAPARCAFSTLLGDCARAGALAEGGIPDFRSNKTKKPQRI